MCVRLQAAGLDPTRWPRESQYAYSDCCVLLRLFSLSYFLFQINSDLVLLSSVPDNSSVTNIFTFLAVSQTLPCPFMGE